jgi:hypothetical protein
MSGRLPLPDPARPWLSRLRIFAFALTTLVQGLLEGVIALVLLGKALLKISSLELQLFKLRMEYAALLFAVDHANAQVGIDGNGGKEVKQAHEESPESKTLGDRSDATLPSTPEERKIIVFSALAALLGFAALVAVVLMLHGCGGGGDAVDEDGHVTTQPVDPAASEARR